MLLNKILSCHSGFRIFAMDNTLYPLKFDPIYKQLIWGGEKLKENYGKTGAPPQTGESWEISGVENNISIVANGFLKGNDLEELIEIYMGDLVGDKVFREFELRFPVLIKYINSNDDLSIQVHPDDRYAEEHHGGKGKTEMWYIMEAEEEAHLIVGFRENIDRKSFMERLNGNTLEKILNFISIEKGDVLFIPAGRIHAIGPGIVLAEIQETSDLTYRIYDWNRTGSNGKPRELHIEHALNVLDYKAHNDYKTDYAHIKNSSVNLADCPYFTTQMIHFDQPVDKDYNLIDSFVIYMCVDGHVDIYYRGGEPVTMKKGETILVPAMLKEISLIPQVESRVLEVYIK